MENSRSANGLAAEQTASRRGLWSNYMISRDAWVPQAPISSMTLRNQHLTLADAANVKARFALVVLFVLLVSIGFLYVGGWVTPHRLTPARIIDTFERVNGLHPGFRRNHAKGVGFSGRFESNGQGSRLSKASIFQPGRVEVVGRFALAGGMPYAADANSTVRSMALRFALPNGEEWRMGMNNIPVFAVNTPQAFTEQLVAMGPDPLTGKPNPVRVKAFFERHPETARAIQVIRVQPPTSGFDDSTFNSLNAFEFIDATGKATAVRWSMVSAQTFAPSVASPKDANFLFTSLIERVNRQPQRWHWVLVIGQRGDPTNDATLAWPQDREKVDVGTLTIDRIQGEQTSPARAIKFDPLIRPNGIAGSDDPLLSARSAAYSQSFTRRVGEPVTASAVATPAAAK